MRSLRSPDANTPVITVDAMWVAFGFSTQKIRGGFGGKFKAMSRRSPSGRRVRSGLRPCRSPAFARVCPPFTVADGLKLNEVYALTLIENAGLELNHVELVPPEKQIRRSHCCSASA